VNAFASELHNIRSSARTKRNQLPSFESRCRCDQGNNRGKSPFVPGRADDKFSLLSLWTKLESKIWINPAKFSGEFVKQSLSFTLASGIEIKKMEYEAPSINRILRGALNVVPVVQVVPALESIQISPAFEPRSALAASTFAPRSEPENNAAQRMFWKFLQRIRVSVNVLGGDTRWGDVA
jgi:hypothetical protein